MRKIYLLLFFVMVLCSLYAEINTDSTWTNRPKIGLVLSGGGAKGFAHIGVLKVLEENGIRPDFITGTSMGSVVGGLYSLGFSANQIEELVCNANWGDLLTDKITWDEIPIFEKLDYPGYLLQLNISQDNKYNLPSGMIQGQKIQNLLSNLSWSSNQYQDYNALPIPYRCVATDIISGQAYVFKKGNLAQAMRASMSIPTVFSPISIDTMLLVDGGVANNFPVQECKDMGADIIIGVYTGFDKKPRKEDLQSMVKILARSSAFYGIQDAKHQAKMADLLIYPNLADIGPENFNKAKEIIDLGEKASKDSLVILKLKEIASLIPKTDTILPFHDTMKIKFDHIQISGNQRISNHSIIKVSKLDIDFPIDADDIDLAIKRIYALWEFEKVTYHIKRDSSNSTLIFNVKERSRHHLNFGLHYDNTYGVNLLVKATYNDLFFKYTKASIKLSISKNPRLKLSYKFYPTRRRKLELSINTYLQTNKMPDIITENDTTYSLGYYSSQRADFNLGLSWSPLKNLSLTMAVGNQANKIVLKEGMEIYYSLNSVSHRMNYLNFNLRYNSLDDPYFPTKGIYIDINNKNSFQSQLLTTDTSILFKDISKSNTTFTLEYKQYIRIFKRISLTPEFTIGIISENPFITEKFYLGGMNYSLRPNFYNFGGIRSNYVSSDNFIIIGISMQVALFNNWYTQLGTQDLIFANNADIDSEDDLEFDDNTFGSWHVGIGYYSKFGPLRLIISKSPERKEYVWSLNLGIPF